MVGVTLRGVSKFFGKVRAVDDVSLTVNEGELFFLLGPSGCGKTTTLRLVAGFYKPDAGDILFDNQIINDTPPYRRNIGMVFQNYALWPHMTVYDNIVYGLKVRGTTAEDRVKKAKEALRTVKMEGYATRYPNQLSGGQQQRIALARALVIEPHVLLLDEPLSNLDAKLRLETREEIKRIQKDLKITTIYVTHDQGEALSMAQRVAVMNEGRIEQMGTPREIYDSPVDRFVAGFIGETNFIEGKVSEAREESITVITESGAEIRAAVSKAFSPGEGVVCSVRPDHIRVLRRRPKPGDQSNMFEAKISSLNYYGSVEHYILSTSEGHELKAIYFDPHESGLREGDRVYISFDGDDVDVFSLN